MRITLKPWDAPTNTDTKFMTFLDNFVYSSLVPLIVSLLFINVSTTTFLDHDCSHILGHVLGDVSDGYHRYCDGQPVADRSPLYHFAVVLSASPRKETTSRSTEAIGKGSCVALGISGGRSGRGMDICRGTTAHTIYPPPRTMHASYLIERQPLHDYWSVLRHRKRTQTDLRDGHRGHPEALT